MSKKYYKKVSDMTPEEHKKRLDYYRKYREKNPKKKVSDMTPEEYKLHREKINAYNRENRDHINSKQREYLKMDRKRNPGKYKEYDRKSNKKKYVKVRSTPEGILKENLRRSLNINLKRKGYTKNSRTHEYLGCSYKEFRIYIETQFKVIDGIQMTWDNIQLDHIHPISWCDTEEEIFIYSHFTNYQPLLREDNASKGNKYIGAPEKYL